MATWRCPHCRTVQAESPRCFLCLRSATSCGTCVNFRRSVVGGVGYCAIDRQRQPLTGAEQRPCWASEPDLSAAFVPGSGPGGHLGAAEGLLFSAPEKPSVPADPRPAAGKRPARGRLIEMEASPPVSGR